MRPKTWLIPRLILPGFLLPGYIPPISCIYLTCLRYFIYACLDLLLPAFKLYISAWLICLPSLDWTDIYYPDIDLQLPDCFSLDPRSILSQPPRNFPPHETSPPPGTTQARTPRTTDVHRKPTVRNLPHTNHNHSSAWSSSLKAPVSSQQCTGREYQIYGSIKSMFTRHNDTGIHLLNWQVTNTVSKWFDFSIYLLIYGQQRQAGGERSNGWMAAKCFGFLSLLARWMDVCGWLVQRTEGGETTEGRRLAGFYCLVSAQTSDGFVKVGKFRKKRWPCTWSIRLS